MNALTDLPPEALEHVARYFRSLAEPKRLAILKLLCDGPLNVGEVAEQIASSQANTSRHLTQMAHCGLVAREHRGNSVYYRMADPMIDELCELVCRSIAHRFLQTADTRAAFDGVTSRST